MSKYQKLIVSDGPVVTTVDCWTGLVSFPDHQQSGCGTRLQRLDIRVGMSKSQCKLSVGKVDVPIPGRHLNQAASPCTLCSVRSTQNAVY